MKQRLVVALFGVSLLAGCNATTGSDEAAVTYAGHWSKADTFSGCLKPLERKWYGSDDYADKYPAGQRTFKFSRDEDADSPPLSIVTKNNVTMEVSGVATFALNVSCNTLRPFHERIGKKYQEQYGTDDLARWFRPLLSTYMKQPLDRALDQEGKTFNWRDLYTSAEAKESWESKVGALAPQLVKQQSGLEVFCQPNYAGAGPCGSFALTLQNPVPPNNIVAALAEEEAAVAQESAQRKRNAAVKTELQSIKELVKELGPDGYIAYRALKMAEEGKTPPTVFVPQGGRVNVNPK